jgi:hypothetical protein
MESVTVGANMPSPTAALRVFHITPPSTLMDEVVHDL